MNPNRLEELLKWARLKRVELIAEKALLKKESRSSDWKISQEVKENIQSIALEGVYASSIHLLYSEPVLDPEGNATYYPDGLMIVKESIPFKIVYDIVKELFDNMD